METFLDRIPNRLFKMALVLLAKFITSRSMMMIQIVKLPSMNHPHRMSCENRHMHNLQFQAFREFGVWVYETLARRTCVCMYVRHAILCINFFWSMRRTISFLRVCTFFCILAFLMALNRLLVRIVCSVGNCGSCEDWNTRPGNGCTWRLATWPQIYYYYTMWII